MGGIEKDRAIRLFQAPLVMEVSRQTKEDRVPFAVATQGMGPRFAHGSGEVVNPVGGLMGDDEVGLHGFEKTVHFVILLADARTDAIRHAVTLGNPGGRSPGASITGDFQRSGGMAFEMEIPVPEGCLPQIHIMIAGQAEGASPGEEGKHVFQEPVVLLENFPGPERRYYRRVGKFCKEYCVQNRQTKRQGNFALDTRERRLPRQCSRGTANLCDFFQDVKRGNG